MAEISLCSNFSAGERERERGTASERKGRYSFLMFGEFICNLFLPVTEVESGCGVHVPCLQQRHVQFFITLNLNFSLI